MAQTEMEVNIDRIRPYLFESNFIVPLGFPSGYVVVRVTAKDKPNYYRYDPIAEGMLATSVPASTSTNGVTNHGFVLPQKPSSQYANGKPFFIFENSKKGTSGFFYQIFFGISPYNGLYVTLQQPFNTWQMNLPIQSPNASYNQFGGIPAVQSKLYAPGPESEIILPPNMDFGIGFINDTPKQANPLILWIVNYLAYEVVTDPNIVYEAMNTTKYRPKTVGGTTNYQYSIEQNFGVSPVQLGMSKTDISSALGVS